MSRLRGSSHLRKDDHHELQIGRLKQDRVKLSRGEDVSGKSGATRHFQVLITMVMLLYQHPNTYDAIFVMP